MGDVRVFDDEIFCPPAETSGGTARKHGRRGFRRGGKLAAATLLLTAALTLTGCGGSGNTPSPTAAPQATESRSEPGPAVVVTPEPEPTPEPTPEPVTGPDLYAQPPIPDTFFDDAAFFGNSLVDGLRLYGNIKNGRFFGVTSASVVSVSTTRNCYLSTGEPATQLEALCENQYGKIYILLGVNEIGFTTEYFIQLYGEMMDSICAMEPDAEIYIMSLTPLTKAKSEDSSPFTEQKVLSYNMALYALAEARGFHYVDLVDALSDAEGYLPPDGSSDGVHLSAGKYLEWCDYLRTHYPPTAETEALIAAAAQPPVEQLPEVDDPELLAGAQGGV